MAFDLKIENLQKYFRKTIKAVDGIDFDVPEKTVFGILGPNGCGKTTTLRMLTTLLSPSCGSIQLGGMNYENISIPKILKTIGYVPQKDALYHYLTVWENLDYFFSAYKYKGNRKKRIAEVLDKVNLSNKKDEFVKNLSGGMIKRLSIACAIIHKPNIVLFDEVTVGLDPLAQEKIWQLILELKQFSTVIMTTHYMEEAQKLCDQIIVMRRGQIVLSGQPQAIIDQFKVDDLHQVMTTFKEENV